MKKSLYIVMMMCLLSGWTARAQRTVDLDFRQVTLNVVFDAIERQTGQPVYRQPLETDSMVRAVKMKGSMPPSSRPMVTRESRMLMPVRLMPTAWA